MKNRSECCEKTKQLTIPASRYGNIHSLACQHEDRHIAFCRGSRYAVVLASYYGKGYTTHRSQAAAVAMSLRMRDYSHAVIDRNGDVYGLYVDNDGTMRLVPIGDNVLGDCE